MEQYRRQRTVPLHIALSAKWQQQYGGRSESEMEAWQLVVINQLCQEAYENAKAKGFWHEGQARNKAEMIALMHSELSEALEELRAGNKPDYIYHDKLRKPEGVPIEIADLLIRVFDFCGGLNINLGQAIAEKMEYNKKRQAMHGKQF